MTVIEAVGPVPYFWLQAAGYLIFSVAWIFLLFCLALGVLEAIEAFEKFCARDRTSLNPARSRIAVSAVGRRPLSSHLSSTPALSLIPARPHRVLLFPVRQFRRKESL